MAPSGPENSSKGLLCEADLTKPDIIENAAGDPERKSSKASLDHFAGAYFSFSKIRIARMILPPAANRPTSRPQRAVHTLPSW